MQPPDAGDDLSRLLAGAAADGVPVDALWQAAYAELKRLARSRLRGSGPHTVLDTTALVNESYLKLAGAGRLNVANRGQFFAYASRVMRSVVIDLVRERQALRRGGDRQHLTLDTAIADQLEQAPEVEDEPLRVDRALAELERLEPRLAKVVEMRYFGGLTEVEIAALLGVTDRTVRRDWQKARLLLRAMLESPRAAGTGAAGTGAAGTGVPGSGGPGSTVADSGTARPAGADSGPAGSGPAGSGPAGSGPSGPG